MEGLLTYFFSPNRFSYAIEDVQWFLNFANEQHQWCYLPAEVEMLMGVVSGGIEDDLVQKKSVLNQKRSEVYDAGDYVRLLS